jgi:hypothetical protein
MQKILHYIAIQFIPYVFWFTMGAGALLVYLAATDYSCRLDDRSMSRTALRLVEEELIELSQPYGPQLPVIDSEVRGDWIPQRVDERFTRFIIGNGT